MPSANQSSRHPWWEGGAPVPGRLVAVGGSQPVGVAFGKEAGVSATVVTDGNGPSAEVDDLDPVGVASLFAFVVVIASMHRVNSAGGHRVAGLHVCRVEHRAGLSRGRVGLFMEPLSAALDHRAMGHTPRTNGGRWIG